MDDSTLFEGADALLRGTMMNPEEMSTADQLLLGIMKAIEHDIWDLAELMARTLAKHIQATGEYPEALPPSELDRLVQQHLAADAFGPS